jgi:hypothetical protein
MVITKASDARPDMTDKFILMPSSWRHAVALLVLCIAGGSSHAALQSAASALPIPSSLFGTWEVTDVHVDTGATRTPLYRPDDFRLIGRIFRFSSGSITSNAPERQDCPSPRIGKSLPAVKLIESSMAGRALPPVLPTAQDYRLQLPGDPKASAFTVKCNGKLWGASLGREDGNRGAWLLPLANGKLALRWYGETILELKRLPEGARPDPSFNCRQASTDSEKRSAAPSRSPSWMSALLVHSLRQRRSCRRPDGETHWLRSRRTSAHGCCSAIAASRTWLAWKSPCLSAWKPSKPCPKTNSCKENPSLRHTKPRPAVLPSPLKPA